jgi:hypothetical protein
VGGHVTVNAGDSVVLSGGSQIVSTTSGSGKGGTITIQAGEVLLGLRPASADTQQPRRHDLPLIFSILTRRPRRPARQSPGVRMASRSASEDGDNFTVAVHDQPPRILQTRAPTVHSPMNR